MLSRATAGNLQRSARYRVLGQRLGIDDELRAAFVVDGACWGVVALLRRDGTFVTREAGFLADVAPHIAQGLCTALLTTATEGRTGAPGTVVVDSNGQIEAATPEAEHWMAELAALTERIGYSEQPPIPSVYIVAARARAALAGRDEGLPSARVRTRTGQWLIVHGSPLRGPDGPDGRVAVVIEPARPAEIAPVIVAAWQLTDREQDVLRLVCQGKGTEQIAQTLFLFPHRPRLPQGAVRQGRREQPGRARGHPVRRPLPRPSVRDGEHRARRRLNTRDPSISTGTQSRRNDRTTSAKAFGSPR